MGKIVCEKKRQLNNHGFSLLELLVVMAIIAVVTVVTMIGINVLYKGNAKKLNKNLYSTISELKTNTMSKAVTGRLLLKGWRRLCYFNDVEKDSSSEYVEKDSYRCGAEGFHLHMRMEHRLRLKQIFQLMKWLLSMPEITVRSRLLR